MCFHDAAFLCEGCVECAHQLSLHLVPIKIGGQSSANLGVIN